MAKRPPNESNAHGDGYQLLFTVIYGGIAAGSALGASVTGDWPFWILAVLAAIFSAITAWMLLSWGIVISRRSAARLVQRNEGRKGG